MSITQPLTRPLTQGITRALTAPGTGGGGGLSNTVDLFIIVGQSNAEGRGTAASSPAAPAGLYWNGSALVALADPVGNADTGSMWPSFSNQWAESTGNRSAFVEAAAGGTTLTPNQSGTNWSALGNLRGAAVTAANAAIAGVNASSYDLGAVYFAWCQGETDAGLINGTTITGPIYETALEGLGDYFKAQVPSMVTMGVVQTGARSNSSGTVEEKTTASTIRHGPIRLAQYRACNDNANLTMLYTGTESFPQHGWHKDAQHYSQPGLNVGGKCAARQLTDPASPAVFSPYLASEAFPDTAFLPTKATRTVSHTMHASASTLAVAVLTRRSSTSGYTLTVTANGVAMRLAGASRANSGSTSARADIYVLDDALYGAPLAGAAVSIVVTSSVNLTGIHIAAIDAYGVIEVDANEWDVQAGVSATTTTADISTYQSTLIITAAASSATSASPLTATFIGGTELLDASVTDGTTAAQAVVGYSSESAPVENKTLSVVWSGNCTHLAQSSIALRASLPGEV